MIRVTAELYELKSAYDFRRMALALTENEIKFVVCTNRWFSFRCVRVEAEMDLEAAAARCVSSGGAERTAPLSAWSIFYKRRVTDTLSCVCAADLMQLWLCVKAWLHVRTLQLGLKGNKPSLRLGFKVSLHWVQLRVKSCQVLNQDSFLISKSLS